MKPIIVALVAVIIWNGLLTGVVLWQRQQVLNDEVDISVLTQNQEGTHDQLQKVTKALNKTTRALNKETARDAIVEDVVRKIVDFLKESVDSQPEKPSSLTQSRVNYANVQ